MDRHVAAHGNKAALIWVPEPESAEAVAVTYRDLYHRVNEFAALLRDFAGLKAGDRVTLHMPMVPELPVTMLACARLGAAHPGRCRHRVQPVEIGSQGRERVPAPPGATSTSSGGWSSRV